MRITTRLQMRGAISLTLAAVIRTVLWPAKPASQQTPTPERLRAHITYLASDKLEGRRTGTSGANAAAEYIAKAFADLKAQTRRRQVQLQAVFPLRRWSRIR